MPQLRKMAPEELKIEDKSKNTGVRKAVAAEYDAMLAEYEIGDHGEVTLEEGENRQTVKNRLTAAAKRKGWALTFRRNKGSVLYFKVEGVAVEEQEEVEVMA